MTDALLDLARLASAGGVLLLSAWLALALLRVRRGHRVLLGGFVCLCGEVFLILQVLSLFSAISARNVALLELGWLLALAALRWPVRDRFPLPPIRPGRWLAAFWREMPGGPGRWPLAAALALVFPITLVTALAVPQNNPDSLAYHLVRSATWRQEGALVHVPTDDHRQNEMPVVAEVGVLWFMLFAPGDRYAGLLQWAASWACAVALYGILRGMALPRGRVALGVALFATLPMVVLQSSTTQNDLLLAAFLAAALYLCQAGFAAARPDAGLLALSATAVGLALGTKGNGLLFAPGFALFSVWAARRAGPVAWTRWLAFGVACALAVGVFSLGHWIRNRTSYGSALLSPTERELRAVRDPDPATFASVSSKSLASFVELGAWADALGIAAPLDAALRGAVEGVHAAVGVDVDSPRTRFFQLFQTTVGARSAPHVYFGALGWLLLLPAGGIVALRFGWIGARRRARDPSLDVAGAFAAVGWLYYLGSCALSAWHPTDGRLLVGFVLCLTPAAVYALDRLARARRALRAPAVALLVALGALSSAEALLWSSRAPILPREGRSVIGASREAMRFWALRPEAADVYAEMAGLLDAHLPPDARVGVALDTREFSYPCFGERLERTCIPTSQALLRAEGVTAFLKRHRLDALLVNPLRLLPDGRQVWWPDEPELARWERELGLRVVRGSLHALVLDADPARN